MKKIDEVTVAWEEVFRTMGLFELEKDSTSTDVHNSPERVAKMWMTELLSGYRPIKELKDAFTVFDPDEDTMVTRDMIVVKNIPFSSVCGHHMLPFIGMAHIGYIPNKKIVGLSKLARTLEYYSRRIQTQERLTGQVADFLFEELDAKGVQVVTSAEHLCMTIRGVRKPGCRTIIPALRGIFNEPHVKAEFISLLNIL